jgi:hypothetical protein
LTLGLAFSQAFTIGKRAESTQTVIVEELA